MRVKEFLKAESVTINACPHRAHCPIGLVCGTDEADGEMSLFPSVVEVSKGDLLWTNLRHEHRVFVISSGVYSCIAHLDQHWDLPFALYGRGSAIGLAELYVPSEMADMYHLEAIVPGQICAFLAKPLRHHLEKLETPRLEMLLSRALVNMSSAALIQSMIVSPARVYDRVALLLATIRELAAQGANAPDTLSLTHDKIAELSKADRVSVTRVLKTLEAEGLVELGYRQIRLLNPNALGAQRAQELIGRLCYL